jgi:proline dehydrogenase
MGFKRQFHCFASTIVSRVAQRVAPKYIAGVDVEDAIRQCRLLGQRGWSSTICPWDGPHDSVTSVASSYRRALQSIGQKKLDCYLSIKVPSLNYDYKLLEELLDLASQFRVRVHFDSLGPESASPSFVLLEQAKKRHSDLGCTLPSRWVRSIGDAETAVQLGVSVRLVKGQWPDPARPTLNVEARFLDLVDVVAGRVPHVGVATHDVRLARQSLARLKKTGTPCELEQLYGLPVRADVVARPLAVATRIYVPYGYAYMPYALSQVAKRPAMMGWLLKDLFFTNPKCASSAQHR